MGGEALPVLETARLRLRPRTLADLEDCFRLDREPGTLRWVDWPLPEGGWHDEAAHRAFIHGRTVHSYPAGLGYWIVARKKHPDEFLGWVLLIPEDAIGPEVEIGWRLLSATRGRGYATEAARTLVDHGFRTVGLDRIVSLIYRANRASNRVAEKLGFRRDNDPQRTNATYIHWLLDRADWQP
ncbi:MAG TPA: GNAT family N-acetyltransferase [Thermohalobaculum sp.]|nr:GNAT family N-acetyltransferase [Thermohalobaculum sp.]